MSLWRGSRKGSEGMHMTKPPAAPPQPKYRIAEAKQLKLEAQRKVDIWQGIE